MKLSKQELKQKISDSITDNEELVISLLEDIEDSMVEGDNQTVIDETKAKELEELKWKYEDLQRKYKERFLGSTEEKEDEEKEDEEMKEEEVIDVKEI